MTNSIKDIEEAVKNRIGEKRFAHTKRVLETALILSKDYNVDLEKLKLAAILHDYAKNMDAQELIKIIKDSGTPVTPLELQDPQILHGPAAAIIVEKEFEIKDREILESIRYHTTGNTELSDLAKIVYIADAVEPSRQYPGVEAIRKVAEKDLDQALLLSLDSTIKLLIKKGRLIHPLSIETRNYLIMKK